MPSWIDLIGQTLLRVSRMIYMWTAYEIKSKLATTKNKLKLATTSIKENRKNKNKQIYVTSDDDKSEIK